MAKVTTKKKGASEDNLEDEFESTPIKSLKKNTDDDNNKAGLASGGNKGNTIKLKDGKNNIRFAPRFKGEQNWYHLHVYAWVRSENDEGEVKPRTIQNSRIHAGTKLDIIEEYIKFCTEELGSSKKGAVKLKAFTGKDGLGYKTMWVAYAWLQSKEDGKTTYTFGDFEFGKAVRNGLNDAAVAEDEEDEITLDPYTDIHEGKCALITYNSKAKKAADYYKTTLGSKAVPLTSEMLQELKSAGKLSEKINKPYTIATFELALKGLEYFDSENEIGLFESEDFQEIIEKVREQYSDEDEEEEEEEPKKKSKSKPAPKSKKVVVEEEDDEDEEEDEDDEDPPFDTDDEDEDEDEDDEEDEKPAKKSKRVVVEEDEDDEDEDEDDEDDEDEEEEVVKPSKSKSKVDQLKAKLKAKKSK